MERDTHHTKRQGLAALITVLVHIAVVVLLLLLVIPTHPHDEPYGGILVNIGDVDQAQGTFNPMPIAPEQPPQEMEPTPETVDEQQLLTQDSEEAPTINQPPAPRKPDPKKLEEERKLREQKAAEEKRRKAEEEERKRQEAIRSRVSGAFGNATKNNGSGTTEGADGKGNEGSPNGNVATGGINTGVGGWGSYSLSGRSIGSGGLPRPAFSAQLEGTIVIEITVDPSGKVISTNIAPGTTISDYRMRQSALQSASKARFSKIEGYNNQVGTITYKYKLN